MTTPAPKDTTAPADAPFDPLASVSDRSGTGRPLQLSRALRRQR
ncbi:hypothetical protein [Streptomyces sp. NPDC093509]